VVDGVHDPLPGAKVADCTSKSIATSG